MLSIFWFRRDLRLDDNAGLYHALRGPHPVLPIFIFDKNILDELPRGDARVGFLQKTIADLNEKLAEMGSTLAVFHGKPEQIWPEILEKYPVAEVFTNHDFEPYALDREAKIAQLFFDKNIKFSTFKDHVIFEKNEVLKDDEKPYTVFTPYSKKWLAKLGSRLFLSENLDKKPETGSFYLKSYPNEKYYSNFFKTKKQAAPTLSELGFEPSNIEIPPLSVARSLIKNYDKNRDFPGLDATSKLGIHFRFGTISIREKARAAQFLNPVFLNELIWRDFYAQIMAHFPHVVGSPFREQYDRVPWRDSEADLEKWKTGQTGYPLVDAGMRQLNATGFMHNRVRMVVASFLTKHLLLDWRLGEAYFAEKLLDFDLASNNGGWQWAAGCGTDAAPYFRIFNPTEQLKRFDTDLVYTKKWVPELGSPEYPIPMVEHVFARERCLRTYKNALG